MDSIIKALYMTLQCHQGPLLLMFPLSWPFLLHSSSGLGNELGPASWGEQFYHLVQRFLLLHVLLSWSISICCPAVTGDPSGGGTCWAGSPLNLNSERWRRCSQRRPSVQGPCVKPKPS